MQLSSETVLLVQNFDTTLTEFVHISKVRIAVMWLKILQADISLKDLLGLFLDLKIRLGSKMRSSVCVCVCAEASANVSYANVDPGWAGLPHCRTSQLITGPSGCLCDWPPHPPPPILLKCSLFSSEGSQSGRCWPSMFGQSFYGELTSMSVCCCFAKLRGWFRFAGAAPEALLSFCPQTTSQAPWVRWWSEAFFLYSSFHS